MERTRSEYDDNRANEDCDELCIGGNSCCCIYKTEPIVEHVYHICNDPKCICHSRERYEGVKVVIDRSFITVATVGKLKMVHYTGTVGFVPLEPKEVSNAELYEIIQEMDVPYE